MIDKLELFMLLARERHFGRAAEAANISQPTLSSAIKQLESQLGVPLVKRGARYQSLTPEGERVLEWARRIVADCRSMSEEMRAARTGIAGKIRLAVIPTALATMAGLTTEFSRAHPAVSFIVLSRTSAEILHMVSHLEADIGITYLDNEPLGDVVSVPLYEERYCFVTADAGAFPDRDRIAWAELDGHPLCLLTPDMQNRRIIDETFAATGKNPGPRFETNSFNAILSLLREGAYAAVLPKEQAGVGQTEGLVVLDLVEPEIRSVIGLVVPSREPMLPVTSALWELSKSVDDAIDNPG